MTASIRWPEYHEDNPSVWNLFERFAFELIRAGRTKLSAKAIFERIRWETSVNTTGDLFKLNNNYTAYYARKFMSDHPQYDGYFATRQTQSCKGEV